MKAIIQILHNIKRDTYHPIVYVSDLVPEKVNEVTRYKSKMHHTSGFETLDEALEDIVTLEENVKEHLYYVSEVIKEIKEVFIWDGEDDPVGTILR